MLTQHIYDFIAIANQFQLKKMQRCCTCANPSDFLVGLQEVEQSGRNCHIPICLQDHYISAKNKSPKISRGALVQPLQVDTTIIYRII